MGQGFAMKRRGRGPGRRISTRPSRQHVRILEETLQRTAASYLKNAGCNTPPINPWRIAEMMKVRVEELSGIGVEGYAEIRAGREQVVLNADSQHTRKVFTLAHELGHVVLFRCQQLGRQVQLIRYRDGLPSPRSKADPVEERLCNRFAVELLMPSDLFRHSIDQAAFGPEQLVKLSDEFGVSIQAAALRSVAFLNGQRLALSRWELRPWPVLCWWYGQGNTPETHNEVELILRLGFMSGLNHGVWSTLRDGRSIIAMRHRVGIVVVASDSRCREKNDPMQLGLFGESRDQEIIARVIPW